MSGIIEQGSGTPDPDVSVAAIRVAADRRSIAVDFDLAGQQETHQLTAEYLRVESPSAAVQGHGPGQKMLIAGKADITIETMDPVGHYAVRIGFSDGHATGLFTWRGLYALAREHEATWSAYLAALAENGLTR